MKKIIFLFVITSLLLTTSCEKEDIISQDSIEFRDDYPCFNTNAFPQLLSLTTGVYLDEPDEAAFKVKRSSESYDWCVVNSEGVVILSAPDQYILTVPISWFEDGDITVYAQGVVTNFWGSLEVNYCEFTNEC